MPFVITKPGLHVTRCGLIVNVFPEFDWIASGIVEGQRHSWFRDDGYSLSQDKRLDIVARKEVSNP